MNITRALFLLMALGVAIGIALLGIEQSYHYGAWLDGQAAQDRQLELLGVKLTLGSGLTLAALNAFKVLLPVMFTVTTSQFLRTVGCVLFLGLAGLSTWSGFSIATLTRAERTSAQTHHTQRLADLREDLGAVLARLKALGETRPAAQIEAELAAEQQSRSWSRSKGCTDATGGDSRLFCTTFNRIRGELAAATEAAGLQTKAEALRTEITKTAPVGAINPELMMIQRHTGMNGDTVGTSRAILFAIVFEFAEAFSIVLAWACRPSSSVAPESAPQEVKRCAPVRSTAGRRAAAAETAPRAGTKTAATAAMPASKSSRGAALLGRPKTAPKAASIGSGQSRRPALTIVAGSALGTTSRPAPSAVSAGAEGAAPSALGKSALGSAQGGSPALAADPILLPEEGGGASTEEAATTRDAEVAAEAIRAFVAGLPQREGGRAAGGDLLAAYDTQRERRGWPKLAHNVFGAHLRLAVQDIGGRKIKTGGKQVYEGVELPIL